MYRSAQEFLILQDSKVMSGSISSSSQKRTHQQPGSASNPIQAIDASFVSPEVKHLLQNPPILNPVTIHPYLQHFVKTDIIVVLPILNESKPSSKMILDLHTQSLVKKVSKRESHIQTKAKVKVGTIRINVGIEEYLVISHLTQGISSSGGDSSLKKPTKSNHIVEMFVM